MKHLFARILKLALLFAAAIPAHLSAQSTLNLFVDASTFVSSSQPTLNFGTLAAMEIAAPTAAQNRTEETLLGLDTSSLQSSFNAQYGAGGWTVTAVTLTFFSNVSTGGTQPNNHSFNQIAAGGFELDWLSDNNWSQTAITWNTLPAILPGTNGNTLASLGDFQYPANASSSSTWTLNLDPNLVNAIDNGAQITILGQPTANSTVGYLYNTVSFNPAELNVTVTPVPEPSTMTLVLLGLVGIWGFGKAGWITRRFDGMG